MVIILWAEHCMIFRVTELMKLVSLLVMWWWVCCSVAWCKLYFCFQILAPQEHQPRVRGWLLAAKDNKVGWVIATCLHNDHVLQRRVQQSLFLFQNKTNIIINIESEILCILCRQFRRIIRCICIVDWFLLIMWMYWGGIVQ